MSKQNFSIIEFDDYDAEWLIPLQIARENGESNPILVCSIVEGAKYSFYPDKYETVDGAPWYLPFTSQLKLLMTFSVVARKDYVLKYLVFEVTNRDAYHLIWSRLSLNHSVACYVFSSDCDLYRLKSRLAKPEVYGLEQKDLKKLATWSYWQLYGGGADEHFAYFHSSKSEDIALFQTYLDASNFAKRYQGIGCMKGYEDSARAFLAMKLKHHDQQSCYFLFRKAHHSLLDVTNQDEHKKWWFENNPRFEEYHEYYTLDDLQQVLGYIAKLKNLLKPVLSIEAVEEFEHKGQVFKIIEIHDATVVDKLLQDDFLTDYMDGFFSADTDIASIKKRILGSEACIFPEELFGLGEWAVVRRRDLCDGWPCTLYTSNVEDLAAYISKERKEYQDKKVNEKPIFHE